MKKLLSLGLMLVMLLSIIPIGSVTASAESAKKESLQWDGEYLRYYVNGEKSNDTLIYTEYYEEWYRPSYYIKDGIWQKAFSGVAEVDGVLYLIMDGYVSKTTQRYKYGDKYLYFNNGAWDTNFTSLSQYDSTWYYYENGVWNPETNDLIKYKGKWFYIEKGVWKHTDTLFKKNGKWFYIENGKWNKNKNDLIKFNGDILCIQNGKWAKKTFIFSDNYNRYYIKNGKWDKKINGVIELNKDLYYVKNGKVNGNHIIKYDGKYLFFKDSKYDKNANGVYYAHIPKALGGPTYQKVLIENGKLLRENTLGKYGYDWIYFKKGISSTKDKHTTIVKYKNKWFYVEDNYWRRGYTSLVKIDNEWYYIKNGKWDDEDAIVSYKGKYFYVKSGKVDLSFCGKVNIYGVTLNVKYGKLKP